MFPGANTARQATRNLTKRHRSGQWDLAYPSLTISRHRVLKNSRARHFGASVNYGLRSGECTPSPVILESQGKGVVWKLGFLCPGKRGAEGGELADRVNRRLILRG